MASDVSLTLCPRYTAVLSIREVTKHKAFNRYVTGLDWPMGR